MPSRAGGRPAPEGIAGAPAARVAPGRGAALRSACLSVCAALLSGCAEPAPPAVPVAGPLLARPGATRRVAVGTGFFVAPGGAVVTAAHVVAGCAAIAVESLDLPRRPAVLDADGTRQDLALLRVDGAAPPSWLRLARSAPAPLAALGYAGAADAPATAAPRIVNRRARPGTPADPALILWLQDSAIAHGWSGGPLVTPDGRVAGVVRAVIPDPRAVGAALDAALPGIAVGIGPGALRYFLGTAGLDADNLDAAAEPARAAASMPARDLATARRAVVRVLCIRPG